MRCPNCKRQTTWKGNPYRPFCSERCKLIDLHNWLSERYRISTPVETREEGGQTPVAEPGAKGERD